MDEKIKSSQIRVRIHKKLPLILARCAEQLPVADCLLCLAVMFLPCDLHFNVLNKLFLKRPQSWARRKARQCFGAAISALFQGSDVKHIKTVPNQCSLSNRIRNSVNYRKSEIKKGKLVSFILIYK